MMNKLQNETENALVKKKVILKIIHDKWNLAGKPKNISIQLKEFEFGEKISPDDIAQIFRGLDEKEKIIKVDSIFPTNVELYKGRAIPDGDPTPYITLFHEGYLAGFHLWGEIYIYNSEDKIVLEINEENLERAIKKYKINKFQFSKEKKVREEIELALKQKIVKSPQKEPVSLITRNKATGDFYFKGKLIEFKNKTAIYYLIFECLFRESNLEGFCSYETIDNYLVKHSKTEYSDRKQILNRIKNGIVNLFRFSNLPQKTPDGKDLIQRMRGRGLILYNPPL